MLAPRDNAVAADTNSAGDVTAACPQLADANVPPAFVFRIVGADGGMALCVDARQLDHLDKLGGSRTLRDAIEYTVLDALPAGTSIAQNPAIAAAVSDAVDLNAARFKARWRQIDPARGVEPLPGVDGILSAALRPLIYVPPGLPAAVVRATWTRDPEGQRLRYAAVSPEADGGVARAMGIGGHAIALPPDLLAQWSGAFAQGDAASGERLSVVTYDDLAGTGAPRRALMTHVHTTGGDDGNVGGTQERVYTSVSGAQVRLPRDVVLGEAPVQPFVGLALHSVDPALTGVAYGYAIPGAADMPATVAFVPYDALWRLWEGRSDAPPADVALPRPLAAAAAQIDTHPDIGRGDLIAAPSVFAPVASITVAPAAQDAADALAAYASAVPGDAAAAVPSPVQRALDGMPVVTDGQLIVVPPDMWAPVRVTYPVALVVKRLFGHVRHDSSDAYQVERVPVAVVHAAPYEVLLEPLDVGAPMESHDALGSYYAAGPRGQHHAESPAGDAAEARSIEAAIRAREAVDGTAGAGPSLDVLMASRQVPTSRERAHWSQFMRRVARGAGGLVPPSPVAAENQQWREEQGEELEGPSSLAGLHIEPLPGTTGPHRVLRYDTARDVWHDVSLARPALPSLSDDDVEALLLAPPTVPGVARTPVAVFYLVGPAGVPVSPADLARSVTFAPEALAGAERQEGRRRAEAQRAQAEARAQARAANARAMAEASEARQPPQAQPPGGSVLGRRKQPPAPSPAPPAAVATRAQPTGFAPAAGAPTPPPLSVGLERQAETSLAVLLASDVPDAVAQLMGVAPGRVRDILTSGAWTAVAAGRDADAERLASIPAEPQNPDGPSVLDVVDNAVYEFTGAGPEIVDQVVDRTARDPRWRPETDGQVTPRRVLGVIAAAFDPVVRARTADPDSNASAVILNRVYFALARQARA